MIEDKIAFSVRHILSKPYSKPYFANWPPIHKRSPHATHIAAASSAWRSTERWQGQA
jgi:hypothetical protein